MVARVFYSLEDTKTPVFVSIGTIIFNVALSIPLSKVLGVAGLGLALSISGLIEILVLFVLLRIKMGDYDKKMKMPKESSTELYIESKKKITR